MSETVSKQKALENLRKDADNIRYLLKKQRSFLCLTECPAFEEVADTRIYGFTCEVHFAVSCGFLTLADGKKMIRELEDDLDDIRDEAFRGQERRNE